MNDQQPHEMLDDVAAYALGALPANDVRRVREHMAGCAECRDEYRALAATVATIGVSAESEHGPSDLLKARIMQRVRSEAVKPSIHERARPPRAPVWPAYLVAAAALVIALLSSVSNISLTGKLHQAEAELARTTSRSIGLSQDLAVQRATIADIADSASKHYDVSSGQVVTDAGRVYIALHDLPEPPHGKVYQAWSLPKGSEKMVPSVTFVPDAHGIAVIGLPSVDARITTAVAVSVEPDGGSKAPTSKPVFVVPLT
jgi:anti-sigma-K factor RskA